MKLIRDGFSLAAGILATICYREGMEVVTTWIVMVWGALASYDFAMLGTDGKHSFITEIMNEFFTDGTKKGDQRELVAKNK